MDIYLTRHGQTISNVNGILQGQLPGELTESGTLQARKLGLRLKDEHFDAIYSSDLHRCIQTLSEVAPHHPYAEPILDSRIREKSAGELEGQKLGIIEKMAKAQGTSTRLYRPPGGETWGEVHERASSVFRDLCERHIEGPAKKVLVISHSGWIKEFINVIRRARNQPTAGHVKSSNTALYIIRVQAKGNAAVPTVILENDTTHLKTK